jgi:phosphoribosylformylglycinamidine synthase
MEKGMTRQNTAQKSGGCLQPEQNWHLRATELPRSNKHPVPLVPVFRARVQVSLRPSVLDPAGEATRAAAARLGVEGVRRLRIGKAIELELEAPDQGTAQSQLELLGDRLFANPVIENWRLELLDLVEEQQ